MYQNSERASFTLYRKGKQRTVNTSKRSHSRYSHFVLYTSVTILPVSASPTQRESNLSRPQTLSLDYK